MEQTAKNAVGRNVRLYFGILLGVMTAVCGAFFIAAVWNVYLSGDGFTRERLTASINALALAPFIIWVVMCFTCFVLWEIFPPESKTGKNDVRYTLYRLKKRMPETASDELKASFDAVKREEKTVKILWLVAGIICLAAAIYTVTYLCLPSSFPSVENKSASVFNMVKRVLPVILAAFAVCCGVAVYEGKSAKKQLQDVKKLTAGEKVKEKPALWNVWRNKAVKKTDKRFYAGLVKFMDFTDKHYIAIIRIAVACVCAAFVIAGIFNGGMNQMLQKAIIICTECIGLG